MHPTLEPGGADGSRPAAHLPLSVPRLDWLDPLKALALLGVLLNHLVEEFGRGPWFTNPSRNWPDLDERLRTFFPIDDPIWIAIPRFLGWLGDAGPGVFIFASGLGLAYSTWTSPGPHAGWVKHFYSRRLTRLFPPYWGAHLLVAALAVLLPVPVVNLGSRDSLLSLAATRLTPSAFFHINPSWWFVWTIVQLYLLFPLLVQLKARYGINWLLTGSLLVTFAARGLGILFADDLYYWMTGLCGLSRLAEFSLGMWVAHALAVRGGLVPQGLATARGALVSGFLLYVTGLVCSAFLVTTVVSSLAVTAGLALLFLGVWNWIRRASSPAAHSLAWIGAHSYGAYLVHQPLVKWAVQLLTPYGIDVALAAAIAMITASVPIGAWLERKSAQIVAWLSRPDWPPQRIGLCAATSLLMILLIAEPLLPPWFGRARAAFQVVLLAGFLTLLVTEIARWGRPPAGGAWVRWWALAATFTAIWIAPPGEADFAVVAALPVVLLAWLACRRDGLHLAPALLGCLVALALLTLTEVAFRRWAPIETPVAWGELPALTSHPTRTYALKPSRTVRLHYNNYDYIVRTNKEGLNGPEIAATRPEPDTFRILIVGNAFTMPEGLPWERAFPALVHARLHECLKPRSVQVINAGVTGYSPPEKLPTLRELAKTYRPDVIIDQFFMTELTWMMQSPTERLEAIGLKATDGSRISHAWRSLQMPNQWRRLRLVAEEFITRSPGQWRFGKALLAYYRIDQVRLYRPETARHLADYYRQLKALAAGNGARALVLYVPGAVEVQAPETLTYFPRTEKLTDAGRYDLDRPFRFLSGAVEASGLPLRSLRPALEAESSTRPYFAASWHWTDAGHRVAAREVVDSLVSGGDVPVACRDGGSLK